MSPVISLAIGLLIVSSTSVFAGNHAFPKKAALIPDKAHASIARIKGYMHATTIQHHEYRAELAALRLSLSNAINLPRESFNGARPEDTTWAAAKIRDDRAMEELYAHYSSEDLSMLAANQPVKEEFELLDGKIVFRSASRLNHYKSNPHKRSTIQLVATRSGPRIAASTALTAEGLRIQASNGCTACHPN